MLMTKQNIPDVVQRGENLVVFRLNLIHYAISVDVIQQIIEMVTIIPVLTTKGWMEGLINYHGHSVPVINLRRHFGLEVTPYHWHTPIILVNILDRLVGLIVDDVLDVTVVSQEQIVNPYSIIPRGILGTALLKSIIVVGNKTILLLDLAHLFDQNQVDALAVTVDTLGEQPGQVTGKKTKKKAEKTAKKEKSAAQKVDEI